MGCICAVSMGQIELLSPVVQGDIVLSINIQHMLNKKYLISFYHIFTHFS